MSDFECPCGLEGDNCTDLVPPLTNASFATNGTCFPDGTDDCSVDATSAKCECTCGWKGDLCDDRITPLGYNSIVGFVFSFVIIVAMIIYLKKTKADNVYDTPKSTFATSHSPCFSTKALMVYRILLFIFFVIDCFFLFPDSGELVFFTNWHFIVYGALTLCGSIISLKYHFNKGQDKGTGFLEVAFLALLEIDLPSTIISTAVVWIFFPYGQDTAEHAKLVSPRILFVHGGTMILLFIETAVNDLYFHIKHFAYLFIFFAIYAAFHTIVMLARNALGQGHCPVYSFLDMSTPLFGVYLVLLMIFFMIAFALCYWMTQCKKSSRKKHHRDVPSSAKMSLTTVGVTTTEDIVA